MASAPGSAAPRTTPGGDRELGLASLQPTTAGNGVLELEAGYLEYDRERRIAVLKEGAHVEFDDLSLWADNVHEDLAHDQVYAQGRIELWRGKDKFQGQTLAYNYRTRRGTLGRLSTSRGVSRIEADRVELLPEKVTGYNVTTTTCDHKPPHYRIEARKMTLIPGERMVLEGARFVVGNTTWFRLPRYTVDLRTGEGMDRFFFRPGYSAARGFSLRSAYQFYPTETLWGRLTFNPSQFEGTNLGTQLHYKLDPDNTGTFDFVRTESNLIRQQANRFELTHQTRMDGGNANYDVLVTETTFGGLGTDQEANVGAHVTRNFPGWTTQLAYEKRLDLDGSAYPFDQIQFLESTPRLSFAQTGSTELMGTGVGLTLDGNLANYTEHAAASSRETGRAEVNLNVALPPVRLGEFQEINASMRQTEDLYGTGDVRHFFSFQANTFEHYGKAFNSGFNYVYQDAMGDESPFASFDTLPGRTHLLTGYLRSGGYDAFTATVFQVTRDFTTGQFAGASSNFVYHTPIGGRRFASVGLTPFYDLSRNPASLDSLRLGSLSANFRIASADRWEHSLITNYNAIESRLQSVATRSGFLVDDRTRIDLDANLSKDLLAASYDLTKLNLGITKDFHDFEGRLRWNAVQEEVFVEFYLKAASEKKLGLGMRYGEVPDLVPTFGAGGLAPMNY